MKMKKDLRIVFMGTPDFAVASLKELVENNYNVVGIITMPDKPAGRGHKTQYSAVKKYAIEQNLPILQPTNLKDESFLEELKILSADLQIVVAFRMLPEVVWNMPKYGTFNLHASLLPQYRGAAPINWAIINGETQTGVTTFFLTHKIDTGNIILQEKTPITEEDNVGSVHDRLMNMGAKLVTKTVDLVLQKEVKTISQEEIVKDKTILKDAPKIFKNTCELSLNKNVEEAHNFVRGLSPYPVAWCKLILPNQKTETTIKLFRTEIEKVEHNQSVGTIIIENKKMKIALKDGFLEVLELQLPNKKRMKTIDFINGLHF